MKLSEGLRLGIPRKDPVIRWLNIVAFCLLAAIALTSCNSTVVPRPVESRQASFDGNEQNSGILGEAPGGYYVTPHFRDRYNALVKTYGADFKVPLRVDEGLTSIEGKRWVIDREHLVKFLEMTAWSRAGLAPTATK